MNYIGLRSKFKSLNGFPTYYKYCSGVMVDKYIDMSYMGIGCNMLGYSHPAVNSSVRNAIIAGNNCTLSPIAEKQLAKEILKISPGYNAVRYARTGGEICKMALDIAKQHRPKGPVVQCGYNGWHLKNMQLSQITYNCHDDILDLLKGPPGILFTESIRDQYPTIRWVTGLTLLQANGWLIIFDEITSGFRFRCGGYYEEMGFKPDMIVYAKAISNGFPMAVLVTTQDIMNVDLWVSSTYWTESIGPTAAIATIKELKKCDYDKLAQMGEIIIESWQNIFSRINDVDIKISPVTNLPTFQFAVDHEAKKKIIVSAMMRAGYLATDKVYLSFAHTFAIICEYLDALDRVVSRNRRKL
jgi:glutamate-1-semialdehyde 2,1-aminomutase